MSIETNLLAHISDQSEEQEMKIEMKGCREMMMMMTAISIFLYDYLLHYLSLLSHLVIVCVRTGMEKRERFHHPDPF